ncbi:hypothetical protein [Streptomyces tropicalis]|uniref:Small CPxCG-related zinc finger protein n=1 Tax=Streptomyces tropicalis TaxID=3034234 RepID=A0ABT6A032_9ACTN|nr:hypothetical protein [Streptomyces tropicalis]MDF3298000.1 hypothetical protein [Streptomyces tropicalis]
MTSPSGDRDRGAVTADDPALACARCGAPSDGPFSTWTCSVEGGVRRYFCETCARAHLRAIEGRIDSAWW